MASARFKRHQSFLARGGIVVALVALGSCESLPQDEPAIPPQAAPPPTPKELANATYTGVYEAPVQLSSGRWEGAPFVPGGASRPTVQLVPDFMLTADLNNSLGEEAVVLLAENSGGSGTHMYLAVVGRQDDTVVSLAAVPLGDRVQLHSARIADGRIALSVIQQGPEDGACCPSQKVTKVWTMEASKLTPISSDITGVLSLSDLSDDEWVLTRITADEPVPAEPEITFALKGDQLSGTSGCNRYSADVKPGDGPGEVRVGAIGTTRRACTDEIMILENRYLDALAGAVRYGFRAGNLAVTWRTDAVDQTMLFSRR